MVVVVSDDPLSAQLDLFGGQFTMQQDTCLATAQHLGCFWLDQLPYVLTVIHSSSCSRLGRYDVYDCLFQKAAWPSSEGWPEQTQTHFCFVWGIG